VINTGDIDVFLGLDVGKGEHHATAVSDCPTPNPSSATCSRNCRPNPDQPASIGALPLAVARDMGCQVAYLPGLTMRRIADLYPGEAKTDAKDAFIIADAARAMPQGLGARTAGCCNRAPAPVPARGGSG
jgi:hypothetical protein